MDPANNNARPKLLAPRPFFMSESERQDYANMWDFLRERREREMPEGQVFCRFYNASNRDIDAIWCREEGQDDYIYVTIPPCRYFEIQTFEGHPWIFRATEDGGRMEICPNGHHVHYPCNAPSKIANTRNGPVKLQAVKIRSPISSNITLKRLCIQQISRCFSTDYVSGLQLPASVQSELLEYYINKISYVHGLCSTTRELPEKEPAIKTVEYLKNVLDDLESQNCDLDLREKLRENMRLFTKITLNSTPSNDSPSTSGFSSSAMEESKKRALVENADSNQSDPQSAPPAKKPSNPS